MLGNRSEESQIAYFSICYRSYFPSFFFLIIRFALSYLNSPYRWGGRTPFGIDCASFVQVVFKAFGVYLSRETYNQKEEGKEIGSITDAKVGDLAFFRSISKDLPHVGIVLGEEIIHACGTVKIDSIDKEGIFNREMKKYTYRFTGIRRVANVV